MSDVQNPPPPSTNQDLPQLIESIEGELMDHIITNMEHRQLSLEEAHELAKDFLAQLPAKDKEELLTKLRSLGDEFPTAKEVYVDVAAPFEEEKRQKTLELMRAHIKNGEIEKAIAVAKGDK